MRVTIQVNEVSATRIKVALEGRLDAAGVDQIETRFVGALAPQGRNAVIDFRGVEFVASLGIRLLVSTARTLARRHGRMVIYGVQEPVREVFEHVALSDLIPIYENEADALSAVTR